jgi:hypothetical protein
MMPLEITKNSNLFKEIARIRVSIRIDLATVLGNIQKEQVDKWT